MELYSSARANLKRGIRRAKLDFKNRIEDHLPSNNLREVWLGVQNITNYKPRPKAVDGNAVLAEELNCFFACFEQKTPEAATSHSPANTSHIFTVGGVSCEVSAKDSKPQKSSRT